MTLQLFRLSKPRFCRPECRSWGDSGHSSCWAGHGRLCCLLWPYRRESL